ncbi:nuclear transport factor 2 family protein [uncultured Croceitalea sp.]|uniref:nuclear transport factor 2 family protein n=1 Tax=uncultured Croceitalea sp. TaxID=1798908 RepID=UPI003305A75E
MDYVKKAQEFLDKAYSGDMDGAREMLHEDMVLKMGGNSALAGEHQGKDGFFGNFGKMMELSQGSYKLTKVHEWVNADKKALLIAEEYVEKNGKEYKFDRIVQYSFDGDLINYVRIYEGDPEIADAAFS